MYETTNYQPYVPSTTSYDYSYNTPDPAFLLVAIGFWLVFALLIVASMWKVFKKAKRPGWASIVPFYNLYVTLKIGGMPGWWLLLLFIPFVNVVFSILMTVYFCKSYGKGTGFIIATLFFPYITYPILAFGNSSYIGPAYHDEPTPTPTFKNTDIDK